MTITWLITDHASATNYLKWKGKKMADDPQAIPENEPIPEPKEGGSDVNAMPVPGVAETEELDYVDPLDADDVEYEEEGSE